MEQLEAYFRQLKQSPLWKDYYRNAGDASDAKPLAKDQLLQVLDAGFCITKEEQGVYLVRSGGSTRRPLVFPVDIQENLQQRQLLAEQLVKQKFIKPGSRVLNLFTYGLMYRTAAIMDDVLERCNASSLPVSAEAKNADVYETMRQFDVQMLLGSPSRLAGFARYVQEHALECSVPDLFFGGEFMPSVYEKMFINTFKCLNIYGLYGSAETGIWAWSHYSEEPGIYRLLNEIVVEIEEPDHSGMGNILVTNLLRKRFPLFRYRIGDRGRLLYRNGERLLELCSREECSFLIDSSSLYIHDFNEITADTDTFQIQLSFAQDSKQLLKVLLVKQMPEEERGAYLSLRRKMLRKLVLLTPSLASAEVELCSAEELYMNPVTSKVPQLADFR